MTEQKLTVGFLGAGIMGAPMAQNIAKAGHDVRVWNRTRNRAEAIAAEGITVAGSAADAVRDADVVVTVLKDGDAVLTVMREAEQALRPGQIWMQSTTASLESVTELAALAAKHGLVYFDAPILGSKQPAETGRLTILAGGPVEHREAVRPIFEAVGVRTLWTGEDASEAPATRLKLVLNSWVLALTHGAAEALALANGLGVDPQLFLGLVADSPANAPYFQLKARQILDDRTSDTTFTVTNGEKDARIIVEAGQQHGVRMDVAAAGAERFRRAAHQGHADHDIAASYFASFDSRLVATSAEPGISMCAPHYIDV